MEFTLSIDGMKNTQILGKTCSGFDNDFHLRLEPLEFFLCLFEESIEILDFIFEFLIPLFREV